MDISSSTSPGTDKGHRGWTQGKRDQALCRWTLCVPAEQLLVGLQDQDRPRGGQSSLLPFGGSVLTCPNKKSFCSSFLSGLFFGLFFFLSAIFQNLCYLYLKPGCLFVHELKKRFQSSIVGFLPFKVGLRLYLGFCHRFSVF